MNNPTATAPVPLALRLALLLAGSVFLLGLSVVLGWWLGWDAWLRLDAQLPSMKFNTALEFMLAALALLAALDGRRMACAWLSGPVIVFAALTLAQSVFDLDFGIDQLLRADHLNRGNVPAGRQAPVSSLFFLLFNLGCLAVARDRAGLADAAAAIIASIVLAIGGASTLGYLLDARPLLGWEGGLAVALHTALGQFGLALAMALGLRGRHSGERPATLGPIAEYALAVTLLLGLLVWRGLVINEQSRQLAAQATEAVWLARRIEDQFREPLRPLARMAQRWRVAGATDETLWRTDAAALVKDVPGLLAVQWLDHDGVVRWIEPEAPSRHLLGTRPNRDPVRKALLAEASARNRTVISEPIQLLQGGIGLLLFSPLRSASSDDGFLVAVVDLQQRLRSMLDDPSRNGPRRIEFAGRVVYSDSDFVSEPQTHWRLTRTPLRGDDPRWTLLTLPRAGAESRSHLPEVVLASVALLAAMLQTALLLAAGNARRAADLQRANAALASHRQAQEQLLDRLRRFNERFQLAADSAHIGVWDWDGHSHTLIWDDWMFRLFDLDPARDDPRRMWRSRVHPDDRARLLAAAELARHGQHPPAIELRVVRRDGSYADLLAHSLPLDIVDGRARRILGVVLDMTERKRLERLQNEFVAAVSHELRTPLTSITGALALVASGTLGALPGPAAKLLEVARSNGARLTALINDLLDMERLLAGGVRIELSTHPLDALVAQAVEANRSYAEPLRVQYRNEGGPHCQVRVDPARLQQVLANLLSNAAKFSPPGSEVRLRWQCGDGEVRIEVIDRGRGIAPAFRDRIFRKFSQADGSDARRQGGTGLGLAISRELVERMGGRIGFESESGAGSTFWIALPSVDANADPA